MPFGDPIIDFNRWAEVYDQSPNPLLHLEERLLPSVLGDPAGLRIVDAGCGTGRWTRELSAQGARVAGFDFAAEMLHRAPRGRVAYGELRRPPVRPASADLVLASFSLSYAPEALESVAALVRPGGRLAVSDWHPDAAEAGWSRSVRVGDALIEPAWRLPPEGPRGLVLEHIVEAPFGEPEREDFPDPGAFAAVAGINAVEIRVWRRPSA